MDETMLKKMLLVMAAASLCGLMLFVAGCSTESPSKYSNDPLQYVYRFTVVNSGELVSDASVIAVFENDNDTLLYCNSEGKVILEARVPLVAACGVSSGLSGAVQEFSVGEVDITVESIPIADTTQVAPKSAATYWFGVYDTNRQGDVRFRYRYRFRYFYCSSWLPGGWWGNPNPNYWTSWNLTDFPYPWKGKKLLVPRRYQWWHSVVYGYSLSRALYIISSS